MVFFFNEVLFISLCVEWFLYGKILISALTLVTLAKEIQLFSGTGLYSGIFAIYLQCPKKDSRTAMIVFYVLCLLFVLSTASVVCDLLNIILYLYMEVSKNPICNLKIFFLKSVLQYISLQQYFDIQSMYFRIEIAQVILTGCCDVIAQFILVRIHIVIRFIPLNLQRSTDVGSCGGKISTS